MLMFASKSPQAAVFLRLRRRRVVIPAYESFGAGELLSLDEVHQTHFDYWPLTFVLHSDVPFGEDDDLFVYTEVRFVETTACTNVGPEPFERFVASHGSGPGPTTTPKPAGSRVHVTSDVRARLLDEFPWLTEDDLPVRAKPRRGPFGRGPDMVAGRDGSDSSASDIEAEAAEELVEDVVIEVADDLAAIREHYAGDPEWRWFHVRVLGGAWTLEHVGVVADTIGGYARTTDVKNWCHLHGWPRQMSFSIRKYGGEAANILGTEFCDRGHYFYELYLAAGSPDDFVYTMEHRNQYEPSMEWLDWITALPIEDDLFAKASSINDLVPLR
jgi:hypothetical protein